MQLATQNQATRHECFRWHGRSQRIPIGVRKHAIRCSAAALPGQQAAQQAVEQQQNYASKRQVLLAASLLALAGSGRPAAATEQCELATTESGLIYCDLEVGTGAVPTKGAFVKAHYIATFAGSDVPFDSSYDRRQPLIFKLGEREVIEGWDEGVLGGQDIPPMREGGKRRLVLPPGPQQRMGTKSLVWMVGMMDALEEAELLQQGQPTTDLIFDIELLPTRRSRQ